MADDELLNTDFARKHPDAFARVLGRGEPAEIAEILKSLPAAISASIASRLPASRMSAMLATGDNVEARWLSDATLDDAKTLLSRIPRENSLTLVNSLGDRSRRRKLLQHLNYPAHSVGALVADVPVRFTSDASAADVLAELRQIETGFPGLIAVVLPDGRFLGVLDLWALLVSAAPGGTIRDFTVRTPTLHPETSLMSAVQDVDWHSHNWMPVVDHEECLLGSVSRASLFAAILRPEESERPTMDLFASLTTDVIRLFGELIDWVLGRRSTS
jgi:Mg/Co/Ni transporter MgtE